MRKGKKKNQQNNKTQGKFSSCTYSHDDEELKMLHIHIRQLCNTLKNKDVTTVIKYTTGSPVRINSTQGEFRDGGILVMSFSYRVML